MLAPNSEQWRAVVNLGSLPQSSAAGGAAPALQLPQAAWRGRSERSTAARQRHRRCAKRRSCLAHGPTNPCASRDGKPAGRRHSSSRDPGKISPRGMALAGRGSASAGLFRHLPSAARSSHRVHRSWPQGPAPAGRPATGASASSESTASRGVGGAQRRPNACVSTGAGNTSGTAALKRSNARSFRSANVSAIFMMPEYAMRAVNT